MSVWTVMQMEKKEIGNLVCSGKRQPSDVMVSYLDVELAPRPRAACSHTAGQTNVCCISRQAEERLPVALNTLCTVSVVVPESDAFG